MPLDLRWVLKKYAGGHDTPMAALAISSMAINIQRSPDGEKKAFLGLWVMTPPLPAFLTSPEKRAHVQPRSVGGQGC